MPDKTRQCFGVLIINVSDPAYGLVIKNQKVAASLYQAANGILPFYGVKKKFIFTANINNIKDVDSALIRPGRCFDVLRFEPLTREQALKVCNKIGKTLPEKKDTRYTIAEIFNQENDTSNVIPLIKTGFGF